MKLNLICLEHSGGVYCVKLVYRRGEIVPEEEQRCCSMAEFPRLSDRLAEVLKNIKLYRNAPVIIIGGIPDAEIVELDMPRLHRVEMFEGLEYELPCHFPGEFADMEWYGRILPEVKHLDDEVKLRCCAVPAKSWEDMIKELSVAGCRFDYWVHPYVEVLVEPGFEECYYPECEPEFIMSQNTESGSSDILPAVWDSDERTVSHNNLLETTGALAVAKRYFRDGGKGIVKKLSSPAYLKIRRSRILQTAAVFLFLASAVFFSLGVIMRMQERIRHYDAVSRALSIVEQKLMHRKKKNLKNLKLQKNFQEVFKQFEECQIGPGQGLVGLSRWLPKDIYITDYAGYGDTVNLTMKNNSSFSLGLNELKKSGYLTPVSVRKRRNRDGSTYIYMKLEQKTPTGELNAKNIP